VPPTKLTQKLKPDTSIPKKITMKKHIAVYVRVSSRKQNMRSQVPDLGRWAESQDQPVKFYRDTFTGKTMDRPQWNKLETAMREGQVSTIVVWRLDRLGRTCKGLVGLFEELRERKVNLISLREHIDLATPAGRMMAQVIAAVAEYETELRGERVAAGQAAARAAGKRWGGSKPGIPKKVTAAHIKTIKILLKERTPIVNIAKAVHLSRRTIYRILEQAK
jgi:DNA invertase Pin-like site-specific DNA recombinase